MEEDGAVDGGYHNQENGVYGNEGDNSISQDEPVSIIQAPKFEQIEIIAYKLSKSNVKKDSTCKINHL